MKSTSNAWRGGSQRGSGCVVTFVSYQRWPLRKYSTPDGFQRAEFLLEGRVHEKRIEQGEKEVAIDRSHSKPYLRLGIKAANEIQFAIHIGVEQ